MKQRLLTRREAAELSREAMLALIGPSVPNAHLLADFELRDIIVTHIPVAIKE